MFIITAHGCCSASQQTEITDFHMWGTTLLGDKGEETLCLEHYLMCIGNTSCFFHILLLFVLFLLCLSSFQKLMLCHKCPFTYLPILPFFGTYPYPALVPFPSVIGGVGKKEVS